MARWPWRSVIRTTRCRSRIARRAPLRIEQAPEAPQASLHDEKERARKEQKVQRLQAGRDHPAVRAAVELLGGEIEDVRDLGEE